MDNALEQARRIINETDREMARLFEQRMAAVETVAQYKEEHNLPVTDPARETRLLSQNLTYIRYPGFVPAYTRFMTEVMAVSRDYQEKRREKSENTLYVHLPAGTYPVRIESGALQKAGELFDLNRKVLVVTDDGVPAAYAAAVAALCRGAVTVTLPQGESAKSLASAQLLLTRMQQAGFTRGDCAVAVGGGVVTDVTGFAASCYMRGIDCYYVPTTVLAQADASVGGKTAVNLNSLKNTVGTFRQPKAVLIDPDVNATLSPRHRRSGMAEIIKMAAIGDEELFTLLENIPPDTVPPEAIRRAVAAKIRVVEQDEKENGLRKILNFGHTVGHAAESLGSLSHGESVAIGMCYLTAPAVKPRLEALLRRFGLPVGTDLDPDALYEALCHDKKATDTGITAVFVPAIGRCELRHIPFARWKTILNTREVLL